MPELPEVQTTVNGISPLVTKRTIKNILIHNSKCRLVPDNALLEQLNTTITEVSRKAKYILLKNKNGYIVIHLGMSGNLKVVATETPLLKHDHVEIVFDNNTVLRYNDQRRFGGVMFIKKEDLDNHKLFNKLGPDALDDSFNTDYLIAKGAKRTIPIKSLLMNNEVVVGVGNIYANESLYEVGINPLNILADIPRDKIDNLILAIKKILKRSIELGGTTLKDFEQPDGKPGYFAQELSCYGKDGEFSEEYQDYFCSIFIAGRNSFFLPAKQPLVGRSKEKHQELLLELMQEAKNKYDKKYKQ